MVYIDDLVDAFILASEGDDSNGESFIIGGDECYTLDQLIDSISAELQKKSFKIHIPVKPFQLLGSICEKICVPFGINPPIYRRRVDFFTKSRAFDIIKASKILKFKPNVHIQDGLAMTANWYRKRGLLKKS